MLVVTSGAVVHEARGGVDGERFNRMKRGLLAANAVSDRAGSGALEACHVLPHCLEVLQVALHVPGGRLALEEAAELFDRVFAFSQ